MNNEAEFVLTPKSDIVFKMLFGSKGSERILKSFLESILEIKLDKIELAEDVQLLPEDLDEKVGILDVKAKTSDGMVIDIEMQRVNYCNIEKRMLFYLSKLYTSELPKGRDYTELNKTITIGILDFEYFKDIKEYHTKWQLREENNKSKTIDEIQMHFIELPKFVRSKKNAEDELTQWLAFIDHTDRGLMEMAKEKNEVVREASEKFGVLTGEARVKRIAFLREKYERDYNNGMRNAIENGRAEGERIGEERGRTQGEKIGENKKQQEIARKLKSMNMSTDAISEATGLSKEEIEKL